jgi:predicted nucleic acid-binding protein
LDSNQATRFEHSKASFGLQNDGIASSLTPLFGLPNVHLDHPALLARALEWHSQGLDFADAFHVAFSQRCKIFYSFDKKMINEAKNIAGCKVTKPY